MEDRGCTGYVFKQDIEDTNLSDSGNVHYDFIVFETLAAAQQRSGPGEEIIQVKVTIEEEPIK